MYPEAQIKQAPARFRVTAIDLARAGALAAMAIYHFAWDLEFFGYLDRGTTAFGGWRLFARIIASSFLFLVGVSLLLAHGERIRWASFWRRLAMVAAAALAISVVTYLAVPGGFIFFGILHQIALASLLGLAFLRLPAVLLAIAAAAVIAAPYYLRHDLFSTPLLWWTGLATITPRSNDFVPLFPWFGAVLAGMAAAKAARTSGLLQWLARWKPGSWSRPFIWAGRHSLAIYLVHQPLLIACVWLAVQVAPPAEETRQVQFRNACEASCAETRDAEFCARYCVCMLDRLESENSLDAVFDRGQDAQVNQRVTDMAAICTAATEQAIEGERHE